MIARIFSVLFLMVVLPVLGRAELQEDRNYYLNQWMAAQDVFSASLGAEQYVAESFHKAFENDNLPAFKRTLEQAKKAGVTKEMYLLHRSISHNAPKIAQFLIENGADLQTVYEGFSPLMTAITLKNCEMATLLIQGGADLNEIVVLPGYHTRLISDHTVETPCVFEQMLAHGAELGPDAQMLNKNREAWHRVLWWRKIADEASFFIKPFRVVSFLALLNVMHKAVRWYREQSNSARRLMPHHASHQQPAPLAKPHLKPPAAPLMMGEIVTYMPSSEPAADSDRGIRTLIATARTALLARDTGALNQHLGTLRDELKTHVVRASLLKSIRNLVQEIDALAMHLSASEHLDVNALTRVREAAATPAASIVAEEPVVEVATAHEAADVQVVRLANGVPKEVPDNLMGSFLEWQNQVQENGLRAARADASRNDEPLKGTDLRSVRLNHKYRLFYRVIRDDGAPYVLVTAVNPHQYKRAMKNG